MIKNKDVVFEVRDLLFHLNKAYAKLEEDAHILNNGEMDIHTFKYLEEVADLMENFKFTATELRKQFMLSYWVKRADNDENENYKKGGER